MLSLGRAGWFLPAFGAPGASGRCATLHGLAACWSLALGRPCLHLRWLYHPAVSLAAVVGCRNLEHEGLAPRPGGCLGPGWSAYWVRRGEFHV